jgi:hypothetical protein
MDREEIRAKAQETSQWQRDPQQLSALLTLAMLEIADELQLMREAIEHKGSAIRGAIERAGDRG